MISEGAALTYAVLYIMAGCLLFAVSLSLLIYQIWKIGRKNP